MADEAERVPSPDGADPSFEAWYEENWPRLVRLALGNLRSAAEAEDVASDTCVKLLRRWDTRRPADPTGWAIVVTANGCRRQARKRARTVEASGAARQVEDGLDLDLLAAIRALPERQRLAISLRYLADLTQAEIAATMGIQPGTAAALLSQARAALRSALGEDR